MAPKYAYRMHTSHVDRGDALAVTANIIIFSLLYATAGAILSFVLYYTFDMYDPKENQGMEWETKGVPFQLFDVIVEISIISVVAFWLVHYINTSAPIIPVRRGLEKFIDSYTSGLFFMFTIFIFLDDLGEKLKYIFHLTLGSTFDVVFPAEGSVLDGTLKYSPEQRKKISAGFLNKV
jgi:hypothetical protein